MIFPVEFNQRDIARPSKPPVMTTHGSTDAWPSFAKGESLLVLPKRPSKEEGRNSGVKLP